MAEPLSKQYTAKELKRWWVAKCEECGWEGLSCECAGGRQMADTGDYEDVYCPKCGSTQLGD